MVIALLELICLVVFLKDLFCGLCFLANICANDMPDTVKSPILLFAEIFQ